MLPSNRSPRSFGESVLRFKDPDGANLALVGIEGETADTPWTDGGIAAEHAIRGFHGITLLVKDTEPTAAVLTGVLGFEERRAREGTAVRLRRKFAAAGNYRDVARRRRLLEGTSGRWLGPPRRVPGGQ